MATSRQIQANQANARRSTGPRTAAGKTKSSLNALKHGLRAQTAVLPNENIADFHALVDELENQFQPATPLEWTLLRQLADAEWRMRRVPLIEAGVLAKKLHESREHYEQHPDQLPADPNLEDTFLLGAMAASDAAGADVFSKLSRYEARLSHRYFRALEHLYRAQQRRQSHVPSATEAASGSESNQRSQTNPIANPTATAARTKQKSGAARSEPHSRGWGTNLRPPRVPDAASQFLVPPSGPHNPRAPQKRPFPVLNSQRPGPDTIVYPTSAAL